MLARNTPALVIDDDGFVDGSVVATGRIAWSEVLRNEVIAQGPQVGVWLSDPDALRARLPFVKRWFVRLRFSTDPHVILPQGLLSSPVVEVAKAMTEAWQRSHGRVEAAAIKPPES